MDMNIKSKMDMNIKIKIFYISVSYHTDDTEIDEHVI